MTVANARTGGLQVARARAFAERAHAGQVYGGAAATEDRPYVEHLDAVAEVLERFGYTHPVLLMGAYLHDVLEDTPVQPDEVARLFGGAVADVVARVTDEPGRNRRERKAATYPKIRESPMAVALKLADRIANVEAALVNTRLLPMYAKEHHAFAQALRRPNEFDGLWDHLNRLLAPHAR